MEKGKCIYITYSPCTPSLAQNHMKENHKAHIITLIMWNFCLMCKRSILQNCLLPHAMHHLKIYRARNLNVLDWYWRDKFAEVEIISSVDFKDGVTCSLSGVSNCLCVEQPSHLFALVSLLGSLTDNGGCWIGIKLSYASVYTPSWTAIRNHGSESSTGLQHDKDLSVEAGEDSKIIGHRIRKRP